MGGYLYTQKATPIMGSKRTKRSRNGADSKPLRRRGHGAEQSSACGDQDDLPSHEGGCREQNCCQFHLQESCEDAMSEDCRQHQRKRPRRVTKLLVDLSEYEEFCLVPQSAPVCYHLPWEALDSRRSSEVAIGDSLHLSLSEVSQVEAASASLDSQAFKHYCGKTQLHIHVCHCGVQGDHKISSHERKLMACKLKIMDTRLSYGTDVWSLAAQLVNPYEVLPSVAIHVLNRAFFKMWELMQMFPSLVPAVTTKPKLLSAHICEGPGGFVQAVRMLRSQGAKGTRTSSAMDFSSDKKGVGDSWFAISLSSPDNKNDALQMQMLKIEEFMSRSDKGHVHYGADESGDVKKPDNISSFVQFVLEKTGGEKMHLITGDGAFDVSDDFSAQEQSHAHLFFCEILIAVQLQCPGGALVLKVFDCFSETMTALLYILASMYKTVEVVRLRTSRVCNSERFVVAKGFHFLPESLEDKLMSISAAWYDAAKDGFSATVKVSRPYPPLFLEALNQGNAALANNQSSSILQAVTVAEDLGERLSFTDNSRHKAIVSTLKRKMKTLDLQRTNAIALCKTLNIPLANQIA